MVEIFSNNQKDQRPVLGLLPARISEISKPLLKAWLNINLVWNVETNGNHEKNAIGTNISIPIPASYNRAIDRIDFHNPIFFTNGFQAAAICNTYIHISESMPNNDQT